MVIFNIGGNMKVKLTSEELKFKQILDLVKDLDTVEFNKLVDIMGTVRKSYQKFSGIRTIDQKMSELEDIKEIDKNLSKELDFIEQ